MEKAWEHSIISKLMSLFDSVHPNKMNSLQENCCLIVSCNTKNVIGVNWSYLGLIVNYKK